MITVDVVAFRRLVVEAVREALAERGDVSTGVGEEYVSVARAAAIAEVSPGTIRDWIKADRLKRYHAGRELRVRCSDLVALLASPTASIDHDSPEALARKAANVLTLKRRTAK